MPTGEAIHVHLRRFLESCRAGEASARGHRPEVRLRWADEDRYFVAGGEDGDEFIHKDLGTALRQDLDAYISAHLLRPAEIEAASLPELEQRRELARALRTAAEEVIGPLVAEEERRKRAWLSRATVQATSYLISLEYIPDTLLGEIAGHERQREMWVKLLGIDALPGYSRPLTVGFLRARPGLILDTALFSTEFERRALDGLLEKNLRAPISEEMGHPVGDPSTRGLEAAIGGVLIHGDNFHALSLLGTQLAGAIDCCYIDPPYNTGNQDFAYHDSFGHSAWLSLMDSRLEAFMPLASPNASLFVSIDDNEVGNLCNLVQRHAPAAELVTLIAVQSNPRGRMMDKYLAKTHEYVAVFAVHGAGGAIRPVEKDLAAQAEYDRVDAGGRYRLLELRNRNPAFTRANRPNLFFPLYGSPADGSVALVRTERHGVEVWPRNSRGVDCCWRWGAAKCAESLRLLVAREVRTGGWRVFAKDYLHRHDGQMATTKAKSIWLDRELNNEHGKEILHDLFGAHVFDFPKPPALVAKCARIGMGESGWFMDFFAGSGTSGQAILELNRAGGKRRFVLVESGRQFDEVLVPRLIKAAYAAKWSEGRAVDGGSVEAFWRVVRLDGGGGERTREIRGRRDGKPNPALHRR